MGLIYNAGTLMGLTGSIGVGTSTYLAAASTRPGLGGCSSSGYSRAPLLAHNDFLDGERPLQDGTGDIFA